MDYISVRGLDKPVPRLIFGTAWFSLDAEAEAHKMMDLYVERGGTAAITERATVLPKVKKSWIVGCARPVSNAKIL